MKWLTNELLAPVARRVGGQVAAALVGVGMAQQHESAVAAGVAWGVVTVAELVASHVSRKRRDREARENWGHNR